VWWATWRSTRWAEREVWAACLLMTSDLSARF
jgi:hypothetical protein